MGYADSNGYGGLTDAVEELLDDLREVVADHLDDVLDEEVDASPYDSVSEYLVHEVDIFTDDLAGDIRWELDEYIHDQLQSRIVDDA